MAVGSGEAKRKAQQKWRETDKTHKIDQVNVRVPLRHKAPFKRFGELLREGKKPSEAFQTAFPKGHAVLLHAAAERRQEQHPEGSEKRATSPAGSTPTGPGKPRSDPKRRAPSVDR